LSHLDFISVLYLLLDIDKLGPSWSWSHSSL